MRRFWLEVVVGSAAAAARSLRTDAPVRATRLAMVSLSVCQRCSGRRGQLIAAGS